MWIQISDTAYNTEALAYVRRTVLKDGEIEIVVMPQGGPVFRFSEADAQALLDYLAIETELARQHVAYCAEKDAITDLKIATLINEFQDRMEANGNG